MEYRQLPDDPKLDLTRNYYNLLIAMVQQAQFDFIRGNSDERLSVLVFLHSDMWDLITSIFRIDPDRGRKEFLRTNVRVISKIRSGEIKRLKHKESPMFSIKPDTRYETAGLGGGL